MHRLTRPLAAAAICLAGLPVLAAGGAPAGDDLRACRAKGQVKVRSDRWIEIKAPKADAGVGEGTQTITDFTTPAFVRSRVYATNGTVLKATGDAGCTWVTMHNTAELDLPRAAQGHAEQDVYTAITAPSNDSLWAASYDEAGGVQRPHVYAATGITNDTLEHPTFQEISNGMPAAGKPVALVGSVIQRNLVYVLIEGPAPDPASGDLTTPARRLYVSYVPSPELPPDVPNVVEAVGVMWKEVPLPAGFSRIEGLEPSMIGNGLWIWSGKSYAMTEDTLADSVEWAPTVTAPGQVTAIDSDFFAQTHVVYETVQGGEERVYDKDGKHTVRGLPTAGLFAHGGRPGVYVASGPGGVFGYDTQVKRWVSIKPKGVPAFTKLRMPSGQLGRVVLAQAKDKLYRWDTYPGELFVPPPPLPSGIGDFPVIPDGRTKLTPMKQIVTVSPGQLQDVRVEFHVKPAPNPLDVYFLLDTTGSMQTAVDGLKASIANIASRMRQALGSEACFGLGEFRDFYPGETQRTYLRGLPITCKDPVAKIKATLEAMPPAAGGSDIPEAQTIALTQAVTGTGQELPDPPVAKYQQAGFRGDSYKVIVLISDASFKQESGYPSKAATINTLNTADVKVVSALVSTQEGDYDKARPDMEEIARGTETLAPAQGVDCDGNRRRSPVDLPGGAPLVCDVGGGSDVNLGPAIVGLLLGVIDPGTLEVDVNDTHHVVQGIKGETSRVVNLKQPSALAFAMPVACSKAQAGKDLPVGLLPTVSEAPVGLYGEVIVRCRPNPVVPPPPPPPPVEEPEIVIIQPQRPPAAVAIANPPPPLTQPINNMNPNAGFSREEQKQFQLAAVGQDASESDEQEQEATEFAISDYRARDSYAAGAMLAGAAVLSTATALAYRRRLQRATRTRTVRV